MKKLKHFCGIIMAAAVTVTALGGCSHSSDAIILKNNQSEEEAKVELSFFGFKADSINLIAIEEALHGFMDQNPDINITYEGVKGTSYWNAFDKRVQTDRIDDIIMVNHDHVLTMSADGKLEDLSVLSTIDNYQESVQSQFVNSDGSVYFLPTCISTYGLYINYDLLKKHNQKIPENWKEFSQVCDYFVSQGITPIVVSGSYTKAIVVAKGLYSVYQQDNTDEILESFNNETTSLAETIRPGIDMLETMILRQWIDCEEALDTEPTSDDLDIYIKGERPFMITGGWASTRINARNPAFSYGVHPFPFLDDGSVLVMNADTCVSVNSGSEHVEEAKRFVEYLTQSDVMWSYCDSQSSFSPMVDDRIPSDKALMPSVEYISNGRNVIGADYRIKLPLEESIVTICRRMLAGMSADDAESLLAELLKQ